MFWTGERGRELGLVDSLGNMRQVIKERYGKDAKMELVSGARTLLGKRIPGVSSSMGFSADQMVAAAASGLAETLEEKAMWGRYGL
ncbi:hypothetical protein D3C87_1964200 [compost metagenome]